MAAMRDFIVLMGISTEQERKDAIRNVMVTRAHFEAALVKVRGSLDRDALQRDPKSRHGRCSITRTSAQF